jgi:hypothetical protein
MALGLLFADVGRLTGGRVQSPAVSDEARIEFVGHHQHEVGLRKGRDDLSDRRRVEQTSDVPKGASGGDAAIVVHQPMMDGDP